MFTEAASVAREGRITPGDLGLWHDAHMEPLQRIVRVIEQRGAVPGIQLAHAGRKASKQPPWRGSLPLTSAEGAWPVVGASPLPFDDKAQTPLELSSADIDGVVAAFETAARRAVAIGFKVIEVHAAHGYLLHQFLSPISNRRADDYGGSPDNRMRLLLRVVDRIRAVVLDRMPLFVRISATDWAEGGISGDDAVHVAMTDHAIPPHPQASPGASVPANEVVALYPRAASEIYLAVAQVADGTNLDAGIARLRAAWQR